MKGDIRAMAAVRYLKDPLSKETPYDRLSIGLDTPIDQIQKKLKELRGKYYAEKKYDELKVLDETRELLRKTSERLKVDIFWYCLLETNPREISDEDER